jgi:alpha/beta superfamily hydrolase
MTICARAGRHAPLIAACLLLLGTAAHAQIEQQVIDIPSRAGVTQRMLVLSPPQPHAAVVLLAGGHGGLQILPDGTFKWGAGNFLVRSRQLFAEQAMMVVVLDAPSDRQSPPFLQGFRQTAEHAADLKAVLAWVRERSKVPVWLVGTSRGTQSAAFVATQLAGAEGPDGVVLTSSILTDPKGRPVPAMPLERIKVPVLVVHHEQDGCGLCSFAEIPGLMSKLDGAPRKQVLSFTGGDNRGDPCEAKAYHGFNGLEREFVAKIAAWMLAKQ